MDARGLVTRARDTANRRVQVVGLTEAGEAAFLRLQQAATAFDARLRAGLADADLDNLGDLLGKLAANVGAAGEAGGAPPWAGLAESRQQS
jgi:MarR family transcriptional regulator for hemolysin